MKSGDARRRGPEPGAGLARRRRNAGLRPPNLTRGDYYGARKKGPSGFIWELNKRNAAEFTCGGGGGGGERGHLSTCRGINFWAPSKGGLTIPESNDERTLSLFRKGHGHRGAGRANFTYA